jgi:hypothetical protein
MKRCMHMGFWSERQEEKDYWEDLNIGGRTIIRDIKWCCVEGIDLAHDGDQWSAVVNTMMNLRVP